MEVDFSPQYYTQVHLPINSHKIKAFGFFKHCFNISFLCKIQFLNCVFKKI
jgi:hypothetical protein